MLNVCHVSASSSDVDTATESANDVVLYQQRS